MPVLILAAVFVIGLVVMMPTRAWSFVKGVGTYVDLEPIGNGLQMRADAAAAYVAMKQAAARVGVHLVATSAFRTMAEQERLWALFQSGEGNLAAKPGYSNHQSGIAVDIQVGNSFSSKEYVWLQANAQRFGFVNTGATFSQKEPWHWEYKP